MSQNSQESQLIEMELSPAMLPQLTELFEMEVELLQGEQTVLPNGYTLVKVTLAGHKLEIFKDFCQMLMSVNSDQITIHYKGLLLSKN